VRNIGRSKLQGGMSRSFEGRIHCLGRHCAEEADEAVLWLELLTESEILKSEMTEGLLKEAKELAAILTASQQTAKRTT
jgi:four helix bundle protein